MNEQFKIHLRLTLNIDLERKYKQKTNPLKAHHYRHVSENESLEGTSLQTCKGKTNPLKAHHYRHVRENEPP